MAAGALQMTDAVEDQRDAVGATLGAAFADDPVQRWLWDRAADPDTARLRFLRFFVDEYFPLGHVHVVGNVGGAALWAPPERDVLHGPSIDDLLALVDDAIGDQALPRLAELARSSAFRSTSPHFYLGVLGVRPELQGGGLGQALVEPVLAGCDRDGIPAHLESSNSRNLTFYERLGFRAIGDFRCGGPTGPLMTVMHRDPA
jgi:GNAT superfamily N-acetyltransferase